MHWRYLIDDRRTSEKYMSFIYRCCCPHSYDIYEGYTEGTTKLDNEDCCASHYHPTEEDIKEMYKKGD